MAVKIIEEPDIYLTPEEHNQLMGEYQRAYMHYFGTPPTFETFVKNRKAQTKWSNHTTPFEG
jgi:sulfur relay (sulfurtransferase) DsrC/TusE family protein